MLTTLRIKNLALVTDLTVEFEEGFTAITGETGAGKSIILGALKLLVGERADRTLIRSGADSCSVEGVFRISSLRKTIEPLLLEHGIDLPEDDDLIVKRSFGANGTNKQFINGSPTTLSLLANFGDLLVDMHGPHDHQSLLDVHRQLSIVDAFAGLAPQRNEFAATRRTIQGLIDERTNLVIDERTYAQQLDLLRFQHQEISQARLVEGEDDSLTQEYQRASNGSRLLQLTQVSLGLLSEDETSLLDQLRQLGKNLHEIQKLDSSASSFVQAQEELTDKFAELQSSMSRYADAVDVDPNRLAELEERLNLLQSLKRKYGASMSAVIQFGRDVSSRLHQLEQRDTELERIRAAVHHETEKLLKLGKTLTQGRQSAATLLSSAVSRELSELGFKQSKFEIRFSPGQSEAGKIPGAMDGMDVIEFLFSPNPGEPAKPLRSIASSGEMARVMLALKTVLAEQDSVPILVFDEVDANVGGETATTVGKKMRKISKKRQVFCITHLAPVAAQASEHMVVSKVVRGDRTESLITRVENETRLRELARMLGGQTPEILEHARSLVTVK
ncbi:MAG: repair protein RecN [Verrucomicrobiales bacterium]|nr:repair protein RecN [Verrucomicrobiales bacterium]MDB6129168.1 repair protein RecN [Verrucomicrobiales bacterium]